MIRSSSGDSAGEVDQLPGGTPVEEFVARENIRRFLAQLDQCSDAEQRKTLSQLLEAERRRLKNMQSQTHVTVRGANRREAV